MNIFLLNRARKGLRDEIQPVPQVLRASFGDGLGQIPWTVSLMEVSSSFSSHQHRHVSHRVGSLLFGYQDTVRVVVAVVHQAPFQDLGAGDSLSGDQETPSSKRYSSHRPLRQLNSRSLSETRRSRPVSAFERLGVGFQSLSGERYLLLAVFHVARVRNVITDGLSPEDTELGTDV